MMMVLCLRVGGVVWFVIRFLLVSCRGKNIGKRFKFFGEKMLVRFVGFIDLDDLVGV